MVSKNGQLLLNIPPKANGQIPEKVRNILLEIGEWLKINGEAIYGTRPWKIYGEGPTVVPEGGFSDNDITTFTDNDIRFTTKGDTLYAIALDIPTNGKIWITSLPRSNYHMKSIELIETNEKLHYKQSREGTLIELPTKKINSKYAFAIRVIGLKKLD